MTEREALAVVAGIKYFQPYVYGRRFTVHTDHNAVRWLMNIKEPTGQLARWAVLLHHCDGRFSRPNWETESSWTARHDSLVHGDLLRASLYGRQG